MATAATTSQVSSLEISLPNGFEALSQIRAMKSSRLKSSPFVNIIGLVTDYQPPCQTKGTDFKCSMELTDQSIQSDSSGIKLIIFWEQWKMPKINGSGDTILGRNVKAQMWNGVVSLLANKSSSFHVLAKDKIPQEMPKFEVPWVSTPADARRPNLAEMAYVIAVNNRSDELPLPTSQEFQDRANQAMNVKDKYSLLKDIKPDTFHDVMGEVRRIYDTGGDRLQLYLSDYSANPLFYNYEWCEARGESTTDGRDGDDYGYLKSKSKPQKEWLGPFGKLTIQLSVYDAHAEFVRETVKERDWVLLRNVQFKMGNLGGNLEGWLRGDQNAHDDKIQISLMRQAGDPDNSDQRWKEGLRRKHNWLKRFKASKEAYSNEQGQLGEKRKRGKERSGIKNSKQRRKERRATTEGRIAAGAAKRHGNTLDINENVRCNHPDMVTMTLSDILKPLPLPLNNTQHQNILSPFTVTKYRVNVRVIDYFPIRIEDFAIGRQVSEFDMLSDYSGGEETDPEEDIRRFRSGKGSPQRKWEWRFALKVEDAAATESARRDSIWLIVDNEAAQGLLSLEQDAANLRTDTSLLQDLREQLFKLWGEVEERKSLAIKAASITSPIPASSGIVAVAASSPPEVNRMPDPDSDNEREPPENRLEKVVLKERDTNPSAGKTVPKLLQPRKDIEENLQTLKAAETIKEKCTGMSIRNKPFTCCIKQYGVKVKEDDPRKANAGEGLRWARRFGMFGTTIV